MFDPPEYDRCGAAKEIITRDFTMTVPSPGGNGDFVTIMANNA